MNMFALCLAFLISLTFSDQCAVDSDNDQCYSCTFTNFQVVTQLIDGAEQVREMHYLVPEGEVPESGWPTAFLFHGTNGWYQVMDSIRGCHGATLEEQKVQASINTVMTIKRLLESGYAVIYPKAKLWQNWHIHWETNDPPYLGTDLDGLAEYENSYDYQYLMAIFELLESGVIGTFDVNNYHMFGFSEGGYMMSRMAVTQSFGRPIQSLGIIAGDYFCICTNCESSPGCSADDVEQLPDSIWENHPPTVFLHGEDDDIVPYFGALRYFNFLQSKGVESEMNNYAGWGHFWPETSSEVLVDWILAHENQEADNADCTAQSAPTNTVGYIPAANAVFWPNVEDMPSDCGDIFWNSDGTVPGAYQRVPDHCCSDAQVLAPLTELWPVSEPENCFLLDPNGDMSVYGTWAGGCADDGTFFYGEKCGGSGFSFLEESAYGACSQPEELCSCIGTVETKEPGCFSIATIILPEEMRTPETVQDAVFLQVEGCIIPEEEMGHAQIVQQMMDGNFQLGGQPNMQFLIADRGTSRIEIQEEMYPDLMHYDDAIYHRDDQAYYDFVLIDVLNVITMPPEDRSSQFVYVDVTYDMLDGERIGFEGHFGYGGENNLENDVMWVYGIFEETGENEELQPDYYTGYQITSYFLCLGTYGYCRTEMLAYHGDNWNAPSPMDAVELTEKLDAAVMKYLNAGGFPPFDWKSDLLFEVVVQDMEPYNSQMDFAGTYTTEQAGELFGWLQSNICQTEECNALYAARPQSFVYAYDGQWLDSGLAIQHFHMGINDDDNEPIWGYAMFAYTGEPACPSQDAMGIDHYPDGCDDFAGWQIVHDYFCMGEFEFCKATAMEMWADIWVPLPQADAEESTEAPCEDDPEWANGRGLTCADVYESYVSLDKVCTSNGLLTNCCAMCAMLEMRTTQAVEDFDLCPEGMMYNAEAYFLPVGASEGMEALCDNAARACARNLECDTAFFATTDCCYSDSAEASDEPEDATGEPEDPSIVCGPFMGPENVCTREDLLSVKPCTSLVQPDTLEGRGDFESAMGVNEMILCDMNTFATADVDPSTMTSEWASQGIDGATGCGPYRILLDDEIYHDEGLYWIAPEQAWHNIKRRYDEYIVYSDGSHQFFGNYTRDPTDYEYLEPTYAIRYPGGERITTFDYFAGGAGGLQDSWNYMVRGSGIATAENGCVELQEYVLFLEDGSDLGHFFPPDGLLPIPFESFRPEGFDFLATFEAIIAQYAEESTEGPSTCGCGEEIGTAFSNLESELQTQMAALMSETLPAQLDALLSVTLTEQIQLALAAALPERFVTAEDFAMLEDKVGDLEMDNNDVMNGMSDMATCMADIAGSMGGGGDDSYEMTDAPAETAAPTEYWQTIGRLLEGGNNKCSTSDNDRAFRLSFTSLENCLTRCRDDDRCQFASTNFMSESSTKYCIGCINLTQAADGWMAYEMLNDRRQLSNVKQLSEIERLRAENQRLRAELAEARRN